MVSIIIAAPSAAEMPPPLPQTWYGTVNVPAQSVIEVWGELGLHAVTTVFWDNSEGRVWTINVPDNLSRPVPAAGAGLAFRCEGHGWAAQVGYWHSGNSSRLNLTFEGGSTPTLTNTPLPTPQLLLLIEAPSSRGGEQDRSQAQLTITIGEDSVTLYVSAEDIVSMLRLLLRAFMEGVP